LKQERAVPACDCARDALDPDEARRPVGPRRLQELDDAVASDVTREALFDVDRIELSTLADQLFEVWPRDMAPGFYDTVVSACRAAGFEPRLDEQAAGNTVWGNLARGRGVALINTSLAAQLPRGISLVELAGPTAALTYDAVWHQDERPLIQQSLQAAAQLASEAGWL